MTDDFLRAYLLRPEVHPVEESCDEERRLHAALMAEPRLKADTAAIKDGDARQNYDVVLRMRDRLVAAGTIEGAYMGLFKGAIDIPPVFVDQLAHVILRMSSMAARIPCACVQPSFSFASRRLLSATGMC